MTFLESMLKQMNAYRAGTIPQDSLTTLRKYFDVDKSLELTKKYAGKEVVTTDSTTVYRSMDTGGNLGDPINFIQNPNQPLGKVYGVVKVLGSGTFVLLDAINQGKVRIIPIGMLKEKPASSPYVAPVVIPNPPNNTTDNTITPPSGPSTSNKAMQIALAIGLVVLLYKSKII